MTACADTGLPRPGVEALRAWIDPLAWWDRAGRIGTAIATARPTNTWHRGRARSPFLTATRSL